MEPQPSDTITFLGTAGARFMVMRQLAASGGIWLDLGGTRLLLDPGPGSIVQAVKRKKDPEKLDAVILSHRHLDHSTDTNVMVEAMTNGGFRRRGQFFAPSDALGEEPVLYSYLRKTLAGVNILEAGGSYTVNDISFTTPVRHIHAAETYGMMFKTPRHTFSYIADSRLFDGLYRYAGSEAMIINMVFTEPHPPVDHLSVPDVEKLVTELKPKTAILSHFGMNVWKAGPWRLAEAMTQKTGIKVIAARDGMVFDLDSMDCIPARRGGKKE
jgi:ribonuclease BN (tRNA processing enzyme)